MFMSFSNRYTFEQYQWWKGSRHGHVFACLFDPRFFFVFLLVESYQRIKEWTVIETLHRISKRVRKITASIYILKNFVDEKKI